MELNINHPLYEEFTELMCDFLESNNKCNFFEYNNCGECWKQFLEEIISK
jgi:hypothetical protein